MVKGKKVSASDDEEVYQLDLGNQSSEDNDSLSSEYSDSEVEEQDYRALADSLAPELRQRVFKKGGESSSEDSASDAEERYEKWGKKRTYWTGDTADLEIGQSFEDAEDEEKAAKDQLQKRIGRMSDSDFSRSAKHLDKKSSSSGSVSLDKIPRDGPAKAEKIVRQVTKLTTKQRLALLSVESPEFAGLMEDLSSLLQDMHGKVKPLSQAVAAAQDSSVADDVVDYLEVKQQLLTAYCTNVTFYLYLKTKGKSVNSHPILKHLLELRYAMEKMRPLDAKLKHQVDRLLKISANGENSNSVELSSSSRPNPLALLAQDNESDRDESDGNPSDSELTYRAQKSLSVPYKETDSGVKQATARADKQRKKLKNSEMMEALQAEFGTAPESNSSSGISGASLDQKKLAAEAEERRKFEEDRFIRLTLSRKEKKTMKRVDRLNGQLGNLADIGDIGEYEDLSRLSVGGKFSGHSSKANTSDALNLAVKAFSKPALHSTPHNVDSEEDCSDYEEVDRHFSGNKRGVQDEDSERAQESNLLDTFAQKKKSFLREKEAHYAPEPRYAGLEETLDVSGGKRGVTYEIMKNKGLTPHRNILNRNPRVKKRVAYEKAVVARRGQVRDVVAGGPNYGGEKTGIKAGIARSRKITN